MEQRTAAAAARMVVTTRRRLASFGLEHLDEARAIELGSGSDDLDSDALSRECARHEDDLSAVARDAVAGRSHAGHLAVDEIRVVLSPCGRSSK
jgi:hypothetical protein